MKSILLIISLIFMLAFSGANAQWEQINTGLYGGRVNCFTQKNTTIFAGTNGGVYISSNNGSNWFEANNGLADVHVNALVNYMGAVIAGTNSGVYITTNNGASWANFRPDLQVAGMAVTNGYILIGTADGQIFVSKDGGITYHISPTEGSNPVYCFFSNGNDLFAGTYYGLYKSNDDGASWTKADNLLTGIDIHVLLLDNSDLYAATSEGIYHSTDFGTSWAKTNSAGLSNIHVWALVAINNQFLAGTSGIAASGVFVSNDYMDNWSQSGTGLTDHDIVTLFVGGSSVYAGTAGRGVFVSNDNGTTWTKSNTGLTALTLNRIVVHNNALYAASASEGFFMSTNFGETWSNSFAGMPESDISALDVTSIAFKDPSTIYIGTYGSGVFKSIDNGISWNAAGSDLVNHHIGCLANYNGVIYAGSVDGGGIYKSTDDGSTWIDASDGLTDFNFRTLTQYGGNLYAGGSNVFYLSSDNPTTWHGTNYFLDYMSPVNDLRIINSQIWVASDEFGVVASADLGNAWSRLSTQIVDPGATALANAGPITFLGTKSSGVYLSTDFGSNWMARNLGLTSKMIRALDIKGDSMFAATDGKGAFRAKISDFTSVDELPPGRENDIMVYPNPAARQSYLKFEGSRRKETISLYGESSKIRTLYSGIIEQGGESLAVDLTGLSSGVYFVRVESSGKLFKIIIE